ncbi:Lactonase, 7-bladed beta-propeller-domain-containing protein [Panaeolus papilionaceus]|nr:Lactonase, 7-bladed beta-propeller-domain-containing protein [Panaeolus papilionaceus]
MVNLTILAGGFSTFIATYIFNSDTATLTLTKRTETGPSPSWIASHPTNLSVLYAVNEVVPSGQLQSFLIDSEGGLQLVDTVSSGGSGPTFTNPLSTGEVTAMNFGSPNCSLVATEPNDPARFLRDSPVVNFPVNGGPSNPHMSLEHKGEVFVPDLGADKIWRLVNDGAPGKFKVQGQIDVAPENGPRHIAIQDDVLFTVNELTSTLTAQQIPAAPNGTTFPVIANVSIIPPTPPTGASGAPFNGSFFGAEILISTPTEKFPDPLIYVSNRNLGPDLDPRGDSIAIFQFKRSGVAPPTTPPQRRRLHSRNFLSYVKRDATPQSLCCTPVDAVQGTLELQAQVFTGLQQIRSMALGRVSDGGDEFLIAGGNVAGGVVVYQRVDGGRDLEEVARNTDIASRTSFAFV